MAYLFPTTNKTSKRARTGPTLHALCWRETGSSPSMDKHELVDPPLHCFRLYPKKNMKRTFERIDFEFGDDFKGFENRVRELLSNTKRFEGFRCPDPIKIYMKRAKRESFDCSKELDETNYVKSVQLAEHNYASPYTSSTSSETSDVDGKGRIIIYVWMVKGNELNSNNNINTSLNRTGSSTIGVGTTNIGCGTNCLPQSGVAVGTNSNVIVAEGTTGGNNDRSASNSGSAGKKGGGTMRDEVSLPQKIAPTGVYSDQGQQPQLTGISVGLDPMQFGSDIGVQMGGIFDDSLSMGVERIAIPDQSIGIQLQNDFHFNNLESGNIEPTPKYIELEGVTVLIPLEALRRIPRRYLKSIDSD